MKTLNILSLCLLLGLNFSTICYADAKLDKKIQDRSLIGSTFSSPVLYEKNLYFIATTGVVYKSGRNFFGLLTSGLDLL